MLSDTLIPRPNGHVAFPAALAPRPFQAQHVAAVGALGLQQLRLLAAQSERRFRRTDSFTYGSGTRSSISGVSVRAWFNSFPGILRRSIPSLSLPFGMIDSLPTLRHTQRSVLA